jgi:hypothetical protein
MKELLAPVRLALVSYWPLMLLIQFIGLCVTLTYFHVEGASAIFSAIARTKSEGGLFFVVTTTILSGGVLPELLKRMKELIHQFVMWGSIGILVDRFYWLQGVLFGFGQDLGTLIPKILVDQLIFTPLIALPFIVSFFLLYEADYNLSRLRQHYSLRLIASRVFPLWLTCLGFWPVMLAIIYSLPQDLQFPLFLFGNAAYSILMIFIARHQVQQYAPNLA